MSQWPPLGRRTAVLTAALRELARRTPFVEPEILGLPAVVRPGATCFDIGAEYGLYSYVLGDLAGPSGAVHCFEPLPGAARVLHTGLRLAGYHNVRPDGSALGSEPEHGTMSLPIRIGLPVHGRAFLTTGADGIGPNVEFASAEAVRVRVTTLDEVCAERGVGRVDFVKADVEGAELAVLQGGMRTIKEHHPALLLEIEDRHLAKYGVTSGDIVALLRGEGYRMHVWTGGSWAEADRVTDERRNYLFSTLI
ncbi:MAG: FkbM family methyltransferase [Streptosporangiales bacterium]|nr:FkbM family methyltransferase [Streptosporangiales bacterium]